jgi:hypothetical protein
MLQDQVRFLKQVHAGLVGGWFRDPECFKYRSLQLTGDEKRLEELQRGVLFGPARLTLELLGCEPESLPLASERFSAAPTLLIFENAAPFMLACRVLRGSGSAAFGRIAYGAGKQVLKAVRYLPLLEPVIGAIEYVGDLDAEGLSIAAELQRLSQLPVEPASSFHQAMLDSAVALGSPDGWPLSEGIEHVDLAKGISFLSSDLHERVGNIVRSGRRIPEEALSCATMTRLLIQPGSSDA